MKKVADVIKSFFEKNEWNYDVLDDENIIISKINMGNAIGSVKIAICIGEDNYIVYSVLNSKVEKKYFSEVSEFLHRANYGLRNGNFEMDYNDGEVRYKTYVNFENIDISEEMVATSIVVGVLMINKYGKGLLKIMIGEGNPQECIQECEDDKNDENISE